MRFLSAIGLGVALFYCAQDALAWGDDGHRVVGELAFQHLSPEARAAVVECLSEPGYETLAEAATWPDTFERRFREYDAMKPFHYVNVAARAPSYVAARDCSDGACIVSALAQFVALLGSTEPPLSIKDRRFAIYWIAHLVGDIHQPLHVAHPDGKGGNVTKVSFFGQTQRPNAHWVWDIGLIDQRSVAAAGRLGSAESAPSDWRTLAASLNAQMQPNRVKTWQRMTSPEALTNEVLALAKAHAFMKADEVVEASYVQAKWPIVAEQLQKAGARLAAILNRALAR